MFHDGQTIYTFRGPFGVPIEIGSSIVLLALVFVGFSFSSIEDLLWSLGIFAILMGSIFLHELGHAWGSIVQGVPVRRIVLYGGGGYCERKVSASAYQDELIVAMGPIVNLTIWAVASLLADYLWTGYFDTETGTEPNWYWVIAILDNIAWFNLILAIFNLMPVQPLDGGKLFHLGLLRVLDQRLAMQITGFVGLVLSIIWIPAMIYMYLSIGWVLFFIPSVALHWSYFRLDQFSHLRRMK